MQTLNEQFIQMNQTVCNLVHSLAQAEARRERAMRRQRWLLFGVAALFVVLFWTGRDPGSIAHAQIPLPSGASNAPLDPQTRARMRESLIDQLPDEEREKLYVFEQEVKWVSQYMQTWDEGMEGAVVALILRDMANSMEAVPGMYEQMQVMNSLMNSMPVVATEMQRMNAQMSVITANMGVMTQNMDSTMGRMGRSMPWMPW
jgi:hypothetical protein